ncbi:MAG: xylulokinase, partial [Alphaproteobacteria bacterium]
MNRDLYLAIDLGTGGMRAALVDRTGHILAFSHKEHEQSVPQYGWSEQRPEDWWQGTVQTVRQVVEKVADAGPRIAAICACGQMHGSVLIDADGNLTRGTALLWNDKRTGPLVEAFTARHAAKSYLSRTANVAAPAWPAFKLQWIAANDPDAYRRAQTLLTPKDYIGFRLTGERAWDLTEASLSFLMDAQARDWSQEQFTLTGLRRDLFPAIRAPGDILGSLSAAAAAEIGLSRDIPVL